jgi:hypothetical protein
MKVLLVDDAGIEEVKEMALDWFATLC